jgi:hypothetical protein
MIAAYEAFPPDELYDSAHEHLTALVRALNGSMTERCRRRLSVIAGEQCLLVGYLARNSGNCAEARLRFGNAATLGCDVEHAGLQARASGSIAQLTSIMFRPEDVAVAAKWALQAERAAATGPMAAEVRSWLATERALAFAAAGDGNRFRAKIDAAQQALDQPEPGEIGGWHVGPWTASHVEWERGRGLVRLGEPVPAQAALRGVLDHLGTRGRVAVTVYLAEACVVAQDPEQACALLNDALTQARRIHYELVVERIVAVRAQFDPRWANLACVRELDERLHLAA